ncbi:unnamed protein product [Darwinula stevensoni]|uniref:Pre-mRNA polyadenylation factor Fip1 domain-containing protein n=1 Tax=Darwinula stevensoni TaxID=69355 RepID=A0A7R8WZR5_9CRUS|nr:unnamed protein product [Darwinula stevensoni]CAG0880430.1 unnamed protein product [Darwinula stevensoni]
MSATAETSVELSQDDDQWLYGDVDSQVSKEDDRKEEVPEPEKPKSEEESNHADLEDTEEKLVTGGDVEEGQLSGEEQEGEPAPPGETPEEEDSDDDNVQVTIGEIKSGTQSGTYPYTPRGGARRSAYGTATVGEPGTEGSGKSGTFTVSDFESPGTINGVPSFDFSIESLEEKPWRKPGADITDYFNYGFTEETWNAYCERQKKLRFESGAGLKVSMVFLNVFFVACCIALAMTTQGGKQDHRLSVLEEPRKPGIIMGRRPGDTSGTMNSAGLAGSLAEDSADVSTIQVMTADKRDFLRKSGVPFPDMSIPPPGYQPQAFPDSFGSEYLPESDPYYQSYEPTADNQRWAVPPPPVAEWELGPPPGLGPIPPGLPPPIPPGALPPQPIPGSDTDGRDSRHSRSTSHMRSRSRERSEERRHRSSRHLRRSRSRSPTERPERLDRHHKRSRHSDRDREKEKSKDRDREERKDKDKEERREEKEKEEKKKDKEKEKDREKRHKREERDRRSRSPSRSSRSRKRARKSHSRSPQ